MDNAHVALGLSVAMATTVYPVVTIATVWFSLEREQLVVEKRGSLSEVAHPIEAPLEAMVSFLSKMTASTRRFLVT